MSTLRAVRLIGLLTSVLSASVAYPQAKPIPLTIGSPAPDLSFATLMQTPPGAHANWNSLRGRIVVLDFWATWCAPCVSAIPKINELAVEFPQVVFISITDEDSERITAFLKSKPLRTWIGFDQDRSMWKAFQVPSIPHTVVVGGDGKLLAVTTPEHLTEAALRDFAAGRVVALPARESRSSNLKWDREEISWNDGVEPHLQVILKPIRTATGGMSYPPGSNRLVADGAPLFALIQSAYNVDAYGMDYRLPRDEQQYRVSVVVPKGSEGTLLPIFRTVLESTFRFRSRRELQEKDVYILRRIGPGGAEPATSNRKPAYWMMRGQIHGEAQPMSRLSSSLTNHLGKPILDETGLSGKYDWDLPYQAGNPAMLMDAVRQKLGLELLPAKRRIEILVIEPKGTIP